MPKRTRKIRHDDETRAKIQAAQIINRLHNHVMGKVDLDNSQVSSAKVLLNKVLPDLASVDMTSMGEKVEMPTHIVLSAAKNDKG